MRKRVLIFSILLLVLAGSVFASTTLSVNPTNSYETVKTSFILGVQNNAGGYSINNISVTLNNYTLDEIDFYPFGWIPVINGNIISFYTTTNLIGPLPGDNGRNFGIKATANLVNSDTPNLWNVLTRDTNNDIYSNYVTVTSLNDSISPSITNIIPSDYSFIKNETINFAITVNEAETSINPNYFFIGYDDNPVMTGSGAVNGYLQLTQSGGNYIITLDPNTKMSLPNSPFLDYRFINLSDAAGNVYDEGNNFIHHLFIDNEKPIMSLTNPINNFNTSDKINPINFVFDISDNSFITNGQGSFSPAVGCKLYINSTEKASLLYNLNTTNAVLSSDLSGLNDGTYEWKIICTDNAGWSQTETRTITLDTTGPVITLDSPVNGSLIKNGTIVGLSVNDELQSNPINVWYTIDNGQTNTTTIFPYNIITNSWSEGTISLVVYAADSLGNLAQKTFEFTVDATSPTLIINSPLPGANSNGLATFLYTATDLSGINKCELYIDDGSGSQLNQTTTSTTNISTILTEGTYTWSITCEDNVELKSSSTPYLLNVDTTPPSPNPTDLIFLSLNNTNDDDGNINIEYIISDPSGISSCSLYVDGIFNQITTPPLQNFTINVASRNEPYIVYITCNDTVNNLYTSPAIDVYYDKTIPIISNIQESTGTTTATIIWDTDELANSIINYSTTLVLDSIIQENINVTSHTLTISSLSESTKYYYQIFSTDRWGNTGNSLVSDFNTSSTPSGGSPGGGGGGGGSSGGSGGGIQVCAEEHFDCGNWNVCQGTLKIGSQSRVCTLKEGIECSGDYQPISLRDCQLPLEEASAEEESSNNMGLTGITGLSIFNGLKSTPAQAILVSLFVILIITAAYKWLRKPKVPDTIYVNE